MAGELVPQTLCPKQKEAVSRAVYANMASDDRYPYEIVRTDFAGDWESYYRVMAAWYGVDVNQIGKAPENSGR